MHLVRYMNIYLYSGKIQYWLCSSLINWEKVILTCAYNILYCKIPVPTSPSLLFIWFMWQQSNRKHLTGRNTPSSLWLIRLYANLFIQMVYYDFWGGLKPTQLERQCIYHYYIVWDEEKKSLPSATWTNILALWRWVTLDFLFVARSQFCLWQNTLILLYSLQQQIINLMHSKFLLAAIDFKGIP